MLLLLYDIGGGDAHAQVLDDEAELYLQNLKNKDIPVSEFCDCVRKYLFEPICDDDEEEGAGVKHIVDSFFICHVIKDLKKTMNGITSMLFLSDYSDFS